MKLSPAKYGRGGAVAPSVDGVPLIDIDAGTFKASVGHRCAAAVSVRAGQPSLARGSGLHSGVNDVLLAS